MTLSLAPWMTAGFDPQIEAGFATAIGKRLENQDFALARVAPGRRGLAAAIADGMGGAKGGRAAAELAVRGFFEGYEAAPETLGPRQAATRALEAINLWIAAQARVDPQCAGMATTFSALLLRRATGHIAHVGDSRIYRLRGAAFERLTNDHVHDAPDMRHVLLRAVGLEDALRVETRSFPLAAHDRFLLCSDGVHGVLSDEALRRLLSAAQSTQMLAQTIVEAAMDAGGADNATALVIDLLDAPPPEREEIREAFAFAPLVKTLAVGDVIDDFRIEAPLARTVVNRLYRACDLRNGGAVVLKFPRSSADDAARAAFIREAWIAARARNSGLGELSPIDAARRSFLYSVAPFYVGETLEARLTRKPISLREGVEIGARLARAVAALHRIGVIHRDIKTDNVILLEAGGLKLIDFGGARAAQLEEFETQDVPGTPNYMAPELFQGERGNEASDLFALGVALYRMFAGAYPYAETEAFSAPRFRGLKPVLAHRPDLPAWLNAALMRAVALDPAARQRDVLELAFELEHGAQNAPSAAPMKRALYERNPLLFWKIVAGVLTLALLASLFARTGAEKKHKPTQERKIEAPALDHQARSRA